MTIKTTIKRVQGNLYVVNQMNKEFWLKPALEKEARWLGVLLAGLAYPRISVIFAAGTLVSRKRAGAGFAIAAGLMAVMVDFTSFGLS